MKKLSFDRIEKLLFRLTMMHSEAEIQEGSEADIVKMLRDIKMALYELKESRELTCDDETIKNAIEYFSRQKESNEMVSQIAKIGGFNIEEEIELANKSAEVAVEALKVFRPQKLN